MTIIMNKRVACFARNTEEISALVAYTIAAFEQSYPGREMENFQR